jgi:hypothetical protein
MGIAKRTVADPVGAAAAVTPTNKLRPAASTGTLSGPLSSHWARR